MHAVADVQAGQGKSKRKGKKKAHQQGKPAGLVIAPNNAAATAKVACISLTAGIVDCCEQVCYTCPQSSHYTCVSSWWLFSLLTAHDVIMSSVTACLSLHSSCSCGPAS